MSCLSCLDREDRDFASGCACDHMEYPPCDPIPPGLSALPVQSLGFPQLRKALLSAAGRDERLNGWAARSDDDLGVMLLESWAYVLDIVHFYNRRHQSRGYLATAPDATALGRIAGLIGYRPRQGTGGTITVAALASAKGLAQLPAGLQVRSQGVPGIPAQVFEASKAATVDPRNNSWVMSPLRSTEFADLIAFAPGAAGVAVGQVVAVTLDGAAQAGARVAEFVGRTLGDGADYRVATLSPAPGGLTGHQLDTIAIYAMAQSATPSTFPEQGQTTPTASSSRTDWILDGIYPQLASDDLVVAETVEGGLTALRITQATSASIELGATAGQVLGKATNVELPSALELRRLHFRAVAAGALINPAWTSMEVDDFVDMWPLLEPPMADRGDAPAPDRLIVGDRGDPGALFLGTVTNADFGKGIAELGVMVEASASTLALPATLYGNLVELTRGQTVANEVLGSADASKPYQRFRLRKKPLTYFPDPVRPGMVRPELEVRVNGILWTRVDSFIAAPKGAQVYLVRHTPDGDADVVFGDAVRPPSGVGNVTATYRFGAGKLAPPPGKLTQVAGKVPNLARIVAPLAVRGGSDAEAPQEIRKAAPRSTLAQGRAVSLADYRAIVAGYPGVIASGVDWTWVPDSQRAGVCAWIVCDGGDVSAELAAALTTAGDPLTNITVAPAVPQPVQLAVDVACDPAFVTADVIAAVTGALADPEGGLLAPRNARIGGALFRSHIAAAVRAVPGVVEVRAILVDGADMVSALQAVAGCYLAFDLVVGGS